jgi:hypothetical protein
MDSLRNSIQAAVDKKQLVVFNGDVRNLAVKLGLPPPITVGNLIRTLDDLPALPSQLGYDSGPIVFGGGVPVGGFAHVTIFRDGTSVFSGHLHDSGATSYNTACVCAVKDIQNRVYLFQHAGNVAGTFGSGSRDDDWNPSGPPNASIVANWADLAHATATFQTSVTLDLGSLVDRTLATIGVVASIIGVIFSGKGSGGKSGGGARQ